MTRLASLSGPVKIGLIAAGIAILLAIIGIFKGAVPADPLSIFMALAISGVSWFVVAWAIATAARDVEADLAEPSDDASPTDH
ncbi:MAG TPA: hypothetical protein ENK30_02860 [Anaerolineae bacterium]|nr:hypothetical protein [Anaerolineae bacterium]